MPAIVQITVTAVAAYAFAGFVLGHDQPLIAAIVAITALGFVMRAAVRVLETVIAMTLGIALAEVLLLAFGAGLQYAVALALTLAVARLVSANAAFAIAAAVQCSLVMLVPAPAGGPFVRTLDAIVGGAFALAATAIIPRDPRRAAIREGRRLIAEHVAVLGELADALRAGRTDAAGGRSRGGATQPLVEAWTASVDSGLAIARVSPIVHARLRPRAPARGSSGLDLATRNLGIIARRIEWVLRDGRPRPEIADVHAASPWPSSSLRTRCGTSRAAARAAGGSRRSPVTSTRSPSSRRAGRRPEHHHRAAAVPRRPPDVDGLESGCRAALLPAD